MSSEYSIHLGDKPIKAQVGALSPSRIMIELEVRSLHDVDTQLRLFLTSDRLLEASLLFQKIAQDLAALIPDVDACCRCVPGTPDDQCAEHGFKAFQIKAAASCPLCGQSSLGGWAHPECIAREEYRPEDTIPREEAAEHVEPPHRWG